MKKLIFVALAFAANNVFAALHPASQSVHDALTRGVEILQLNDQTERRAQMCGLLDESFDSRHIAGQWLGDYANISRDQKAIDRFPGMVTEILIMKVFGDMSGEGGKMDGTFQVHDNPVVREDGTFDVTVTVTTSGGNSYDGNIFLKADGNAFRAMDIQYMGMSAVEFQGQEFQSILEEEYNKDLTASMPVSALIAQIEADANYVSCP